MSAIDGKVGARIRMRRKARGLTLREVAKALDVTVSQIGRYERGDCGTDPETLAKLAALLRCKAADFLKGIEGR